MRVKLSYFLEQNGNAMTIEVEIGQIVSEDNWPIILTTEDDVVLETCNNEQELRAALQRRNIL